MKYWKWKMKRSDDEEEVMKCEYSMMVMTEKWNENGCEERRNAAARYSSEQCGQWPERRRISAVEMSMKCRSNEKWAFRAYSIYYWISIKFILLFQNMNIYY